MPLFGLNISCLIDVRFVFSLKARDRHSYPRQACPLTMAHDVQLSPPGDI